MSLEMNHQQIHVIFCMMVQKGLLGIFWLATLLHDSIRKRIQANRGGDGYLKTKSSRMSLNAGKKIGIVHLKSKNMTPNCQQGGPYKP